MMLAEVDKNPTVLLLLDEVEKAYPRSITGIVTSNGRW